MTKMLVIILIVGFAKTTYASEVIPLRGTIAVLHCQTKDQKEDCVLSNSEALPFQVVMEKYNDDLEVGIYEFKIYKENSHNFGGTLKIFKYVGDNAAPIFEIHVFTEYSIDGNPDSQLRSYLGFLMTNDIHNMGQLNLWGRRVGKDSDNYAPFVIVGSGEEKQALH